MPRGKKKKNALSYSPHLSGWDPLDYLFASFLLEPRCDELGGGNPASQREPQPTGTSPKTLEWLRQLREEASEERLQQQRSPRPELGWCEWCPQPRHREAVCTYTGPYGCCCCVFPDEEDELGDLLDTSGVEHSSVVCGDGFPPAPPGFSAPNAGLGYGRALLRPLPSPRPDSAPPPLRASSAAGSESWGGEYGKDCGGSGPEEELKADVVQGGDDDGLAPAGGEDSRQDPQPLVLACGEDGRQGPQPPVSAPRPAQRHSQEPEATEVGLETARDPAPACPEPFRAAAPGSTRDGDPAATPAAAPTATTDSGQPTPAGGTPDSPSASPAAAVPSVPECGPGSDGPAAPTAAVESGPDFFAGVSPVGVLTPVLLATPPAVPSQPHRPSQHSAVTPPLAPRTDGPRLAARGRLDVSPGPSLEKEGRKTELSPPPSSRCLSSFAPVTRKRLTFDPGGWKLRGRECGVRRRGSRGSAPRQDAQPLSSRLSWGA